jgi:hypothetical protein
VTEWRVGGADVMRADDAEVAVASADLAILVQNHRVYDVDRLVSLSKRFFDTRGATSGEKAYRL